MWKGSVLGMAGLGSSMCRFLVAGLHSSLRGGQVHRQLTISQFNRAPSDGSYRRIATYYEYIEYGSIGEVEGKALYDDSLADSDYWFNNS